MFFIDFSNRDWFSFVLYSCDKFEQARVSLFVDLYVYVKPAYLNCDFIQGKRVVDRVIIPLLSQTLGYVCEYLADEAHN